MKQHLGAGLKALVTSSKKYNHKYNLEETTADSFQAGKVTTLHNIVHHPLEEIERELMGFAKKRPIGLILPALFSELERPALEHIVDELIDAS